MKIQDLIPDNCIREDIMKLHRCFSKSGFRIYPVGGCVRDALMGECPHDYDLCTDADPWKICEILQENDVSYHAPAIEYGTVVTDFKRGKSVCSYEITSFRLEDEYADGRHPGKLSFGTDLKTDLSRRDFTINAIAYDLSSGEIVDFYDGVSDLKNRRIQCVGNASRRFQEDGLRILRAIRFAVRYRADIAPETSAAIHMNLETLDNISKERIWMEFKKLFSMNKPIAKVFMEFSDVIFHLIPELRPCFHFNQNNKYHKHDVYEHLLAVTDLCDTTKFEIKLAALLHDIGKPDSYTEDQDGHGHFYGHPAVSATIAKSLLKSDFKGLRTEECSRIVNLIENHDKYIASTKKAVRKFISTFGNDFLEDWVILKRADFDDHIFPGELPDNRFTNIPEVLKIRDELIAEDSCFSIKNLAVNGNDLMQELDLKPGETIGLILNQLLEAVINEKVENVKENLLCFSKKLV